MGDILGKRRSVFEIRMDILQALVNKKDRILALMYATNTCFNTFETQWKILSKNKLVEKVRVQEHNLYLITPAGRGILRRYLKLRKDSEEVK